jgi:hypothetical protein
VVDPGLICSELKQNNSPLKVQVAPPGVAVSRAVGAAVTARAAVVPCATVADSAHEAAGVAPTRYRNIYVPATSLKPYR